MTDDKKSLAILCGGGPAPGINSVIGAATIRACLSGSQVLGIQEGFRYLMEGDTTHVTPLGIGEVSRIHFRGGSHLGTARANPTTTPERLARTLESLDTLGVDKLVTIGGDDTAFSAHKLAEASRAQGGQLRVVHVPKTIDNDLDLPDDICTFGYQTARSLGVDLVKNLMVDAKTTSRWYFVVAMGRKAGHLALGIGKAAGATLTLIPEELSKEQARLAYLADTLVGAIVKRLAAGRPDGVAVLAEGLVEALPESDLEGLAGIERDAHGHLRLSEIDFGAIVKSAVQARLSELGVAATVVAKNIGYELRCADPIPFDMEYTRDLGYCAARYVIEGGSNALISIQNGHFQPIPFSSIMDPKTGRMRVRMVNVTSDRYAIARSYMIRLGREDLDDPRTLARLATTANLTPEAFRSRFAPLVAEEPQPMSMHATS